MPKKPKDYILSKGVILIFITIIIVAGITYYGNIKKINNLKIKIDRLEAQIVAAEQERQALNEELDKLDSDQYIEKIARQKLGLVKPGEVLLIPVEENIEQEENEPEQEENKPE